MKDLSVMQSVAAGLGVDVNFLGAKAGNGIRMAFTGVSAVPSVIIRDEKKSWKLSSSRYVLVDIKNPGVKDVFIECRLLGSGWLGCGQLIPAGKMRTLRIYINRGDFAPYISKAFAAMSAQPGGLVAIFTTPPPDAVNKISILMIDPPKGSVIEIRNIRKEGEIDPPSEKEIAGSYFPFIDEFGQFRYKEWPGKTNSVEDMKKSGEMESKDLANNKYPEWSRYGGWLNGPRQKSTGHFRTEKVDGKWWLVDPEGYLFWSHGMGTVDLNGYPTPVTDREHYFKGLPDSVQFKSFYAVQGPNYSGFYKGRRAKTFNHYSYNLSRKFGDDWKMKATAVAHARLRSWGQNTIGGWSSRDIYGKDLTPYTVTLEVRSAFIEGSEGHSGKFPDPYNNELVEEIRNSVRKNASSATDPYCIGYFVDNELTWGDSTYLAKAIMSSPATQPAKLAMKDWLEKKYGTVEALNSKWSTSFADWNAFLNNRTVAMIKTNDYNEFTEVVTHRYFNTMKATLKESAPDKLYLGCRFDFHFYPSEDKKDDWLVRIAAQYCDVVSFNRYRYSAADLKPSNIDKPVIIGEWQIGAMDRGMLHYSLKFSENQKNRAELYQYYLKTCLRNPFIVGAHWFEYVDQPVTGRFDGENYNTGFIDVCDRPYPEMVEASRTIGRTMYKIRAQK